MIQVAGNSVDTFDEARSYTRRYAKTFYFASHVLPLEKRKASYAVYAFCRFADNAADDRSGSQGDSSVIQQRLGLLKEDLRQLYDVGSAGETRWRALREVIERYQIPHEYFFDLIRGVEMDLTRSRYETFEELREYCYCVASVVGLIMTRIFGAVHPSALDHAVSMGIAMQLTNILRDLREDFDLGRIYLPREEMEAFGYGEGDLAQHVVDSRFRRLMHFQIERARDYYARAAKGIPYIEDDRSRLCVRLMSDLYARILDVIVEHDFDVFSRRATVSFGRKVGTAARIGVKWKSGSHQTITTETTAFMDRRKI